MSERVCRGAAMVVVVVGIVVSSGCVAIPCGKTLRSGGDWTMVEARKEHLGTVLSVADDPTNRVLVCAPYSQFRIHEERQKETQEDERKLVVGILPGLGASWWIGEKHHGFGEGNSEDTFTQYIGAPLFVLTMSVFTLGIGEILGQCAEIGRPWSPPGGRDLSGLIAAGFAKTCRRKTTLHREPVSSRIVNEPVSDVDIRVQIPAVGWSQQFRTPAGGIQLSYASIPVASTSECLRTVLDMDGAQSSGSATPVLLKGSLVGENAVRGVFSGARMPSVIYTDVPSCDLNYVPIAAAPKPTVETSFVPTKSGDASGIEMVVKVSNEGRGPLSQLIGRTQSPVPEFDGRLIPFGRIDPGKSLTRSVRLPVGKDMKSGQYPVDVRFVEGNQYAPQPTRAIATVRALPRPALVFSWRVDDVQRAGTKIVGNGDGVLQWGEAVDFVVTVKNTGDGWAQASKVTFGTKETRAIKIFDVPDAALGDIAPDESKTCRFNIGLLPSGNIASIPVSVRVTEESFSIQEVQRFDLPFNSQIQRNPIVLDTTYYVKADETVLREGAAENAAEFARIKKDVALHAVGQLDDWVQVEMEVKESGSTSRNRYWARSDALTSTAPKDVVRLASAEITVTRYETPPPTIVFVQPETDTITTHDDSMQVVVSVAEAKGSLADVRFFADDVEVRQTGDRGIKVVETASTKGALAEKTIRYPANLKMGVNRFSVTAKNDQGKSTSRALTVTRVEKVGKTHVICIGINKYQDPQTLAAATQDAEAFHSFASERLGVARGDGYLLTDEGATREAIMDCFDKVLKAAKPEDSVVVLLAGHGVIEKRRNREEKYFVPFDGKWGQLFSTAIRMEDFNSMLAMDAKRVLVVADACYSASVVRPRGEADVFGKLAGEGKIVIGYNRPAQEDKELKHGYLTYYMLEGLKGSADMNKDGRITLREAYEYASEKVKKRTGFGLWIQGEGDMELVSVRSER